MLVRLLYFWPHIVISTNMTLCMELGNESVYCGMKLGNESSNMRYTLFSWLIASTALQIKLEVHVQFPPSQARSPRSHACERGAWEQGYNFPALK